MIHVSCVRTQANRKSFKWCSESVLSGLTAGANSMNSLTKSNKWRSRCISNCGICYCLTSSVLCDFAKWTDVCLHQRNKITSFEIALENINVNQQSFEVFTGSVFSLESFNGTNLRNMNTTSNCQTHLRYLNLI